MEKHEIYRIFPGTEEKIADSVTREIPLTIYVNDEEIVTLLSSPTDLKELAVGFLFTSGLIKNADEVMSISVDTRVWTVYLQLRDRQIDSRLVFKRMFTSGCGRGTMFYKSVDLLHRNKQRVGIKIDRNLVFCLVRELEIRSSEFKMTGCAHSAALADKNGILIIREDIGRHNAVDKVLGYAIINKIDLEDKILISSGRISSEILLKVQKTGICIVASRSAPTDQAIKHAKDNGITLIGFVRGQRMNIYSRRERIL